jgi:tetratricopeptide (TPR) repeat protein
MRAFLILVSAIALLPCSIFVPPAAAQRQYSRQGAQAIINTQDWNRLLAYGNAWARAEPNNADAWFVIGRAYGSKAFGVGLGRPLDAAAAFEHAVQVQPQSLDSWVALGMTDEELGRWAAAAVAFQHRVQINPDNTHYWDQLAISYGHAQQFRLEADAIANLETHAKDVQDWNMAGTDLSAMAPFYETATTLQNARVAFERGLQLDPRNGNLVNNLGIVEQFAGNWQAALADYQKAASLGNPLGRTNYDSLQKTLAAEKAAAASRASNANRCILCEVQVGQARQYIVNHPGASMGEAMAAVNSH